MTIKLEKVPLRIKDDPVLKVIVRIRTILSVQCTNMPMGSYILDV